MKVRTFTSPGLALLAAMSLTVTLATGTTNAPPVDTAALSAFMQKWQSPPADDLPERPADRPLLLAALAKNPTGPWAGYLDMVAANARYQIRQVKRTERQAWATALLPTLEQAEQIQEQLRAAGTAITNRPLPFVCERGRYPEAKAFLSLEAGLDLAALKADAQRELAGNQKTNDWNYGNVVFRANTVLGRIAVKEGNFTEAHRCLRAAAHSSGSPQLNSFGPDLVLPRELLEHGDKEDRETVLAFLDDLRKWYGDPATQPEANSRRVSEDRLKEVDLWQQEIRAGKVPTHWKWD